MQSGLFILEQQDTDNVTTDRGPVDRMAFKRAIAAYPWHREADAAERSQQFAPALCVHDLQTDRGMFLSCFRFRGEYRYTVARLYPAMLRSWFFRKRYGRRIDTWEIEETRAQRERLDRCLDLYFARSFDELDRETARWSKLSANSATGIADAGWEQYLRLKAKHTR